MWLFVLCQEHNTNINYQCWLNIHSQVTGFCLGGSSPMQEDLGQQENNNLEKGRQKRRIITLGVIPQGCQMACFENNLGKFWSVLQWKTLVYIGTLWPFGLFYDN
jgi:hypothetical protein